MMAKRSPTRRQLSCLALCFLSACGRVPRIADFDDGLPRAEPACYEAQDATVTVTICEAPDAGLIDDLKAGRWLPRSARALRARTVIQYGNDESAARERMSASSKRDRAYVIPHFDPEHSVAGWDLFDEDARIAILALELDEHWVLVYSQFPAANGHEARASLQRFLDSSDPIASRAQKLYPRCTKLRSKSRGRGPPESRARTLRTSIACGPRPQTPTSNFSHQSRSYRTTQPCRTTRSCRTMRPYRMIWTSRSTRPLPL